MIIIRSCKFCAKQLDENSHLNRLHCSIRCRDKYHRHFGNGKRSTKHKIGNQNEFRSQSNKSTH